MGTTRVLVGYTPMTGGEEIYGLQERLIGYTPVVTTGGDPVMGMCVGVDLCWDGTVKKRGVPCLPQAPPDETISEEEDPDDPLVDVKVEDGDAMADMTLAQLALLDPPMTRCANGQLTHDKCDYPRLSGIALSGSVCAGLDGNLSASTAYGYESCTAPATDSMIRKASGDGVVTLQAVTTYCPAHSSLVGIEVLTDPVSGAQVQACLYDCTAATLPVELSTRIYGDSTAGLVGKADYQCAEQEPVFPPPPPTTTTTTTVPPSVVEEPVDVPLEDVAVPGVEVEEEEAAVDGQEPGPVVGGPFMPVGPSVEVAESPLVDVLRDCPAMGLEYAISEAGGFETYWVTFRQVVDEENGGMTWVPVEMWPLFRNYRGVWQVVVGDCVWKPTATRTITGEYYAWEPAHHEAIQRLAPEWMKQWNADWFTDEMKQRARDVWIDHGIQDRLCVMPRPDAALPGGMPGPQEPLVLEPLAGDDCELWWYPHSGPMWFQVYVIWTAEDGSQAEVAAEVGDVYVHDPLDFIIERFMWSRFP